MRKVAELDAKNPAMSFAPAPPPTVTPALRDAAERWVRPRLRETPRVLSCIRLPLSFDPAPLQGDIAALPDDDWVPHFNTSYYTGDWSGVALRSVGGAARALYPDPNPDGVWEDTEILGYCPALAAAVAAFECEKTSVRLLRLGPGASVREHTDYNLGYEDGEVRFHVPVLTNPGRRVRARRSRNCHAAGRDAGTSTSTCVIASPTRARHRVSISSSTASSTTGSVGRSRPAWRADRPLELYEHLVGADFDELVLRAERA